jgi:hypothetical protein
VTSRITKLFRRTKIYTEYRIENTIQNILKHHSETDKYNRSGIYQKKCLDYPLKYIGQTGRTFKTRYKEYIQAITNSNGNSGCSDYILHTGHTYGNITDTMDTIKQGEKINT